MTNARRRFLLIARLLLFAGVFGSVALVTSVPLLRRDPSRGAPRPVPSAILGASVGAALLGGIGVLLGRPVRSRRPIASSSTEGPTGGLPAGSSWPVLLFLVLGTAHSLTTPLFEGPDEDSHFKYAQYVARTGRIPSLVDRDLSIYERIQPPLAYALLAPLLRASGAEKIVTLCSPNPGFVRAGGADRSVWLHGRDEEFPYRGDVALLHALRLFGLLFGAATVFLACAIGSEVFPGRPALARGVGWAIALLPQFAHVCGCFTNDSAAAALGAATLLLLLRCLRTGGPLLAFGAGAAAGAAGLAKLTGLALVPIGCAAALLAGGRGSRFGRAGLFLAGSTLAAGWYFAGNALLYGDPLANLPLHRLIDPPAPSGADPYTTWADLFPSTLFLSFFADFGAMAVLPPRAAVVLFGAVLALGGAAWTLGRGVARRPLLLFAVAFGALALQVRFNAEIFQPQGRHLFFALPALASLLVGGFGALSPRSAGRGVGGAILGLGLGHALAFFGGLVPAYHPLNAREDPYRAITNASERLPPSTASIEIEGPADGSAIVDPPGLRWSPAPGAAYEVQLSVGEADFDRPNWDLSRPVKRSHADWSQFLSGSFEFPRVEWGGLPPGRPVFWRVVRLVPAEEVLAGAGRFESSEVRSVFRRER